MPSSSEIESVIAKLVNTAEALIKARGEGRFKHEMVVQIATHLYPDIDRKYLDDVIEKTVDKINAKCLGCGK